MIDNIQKRAMALGEYGCYFFSILKLAEYAGAGPSDAFAIFQIAIDADWCGDDAYMKDPATMMNDLTGSVWEVKKAGPGHDLPLGYKLIPGELEILRYERQRPGGLDPVAHFVVGDGAGHPAWDPWEGSLTVAQGALVSRRIFRRV